MGERKVLNKYFPPDFDPSLIPRRKKPKNEQVEVRMMLPFSIQCATCGEYMYRGKKFNSRKEEVLEENYHGIRIYRFYIKCVTCSSEITFKTDPKRGDYVAEHGCQRNFEPWRETEDEQEAAVAQRAEEEKGDAMKALENRTLDSKREMDILDALDEIKAINQRHAKVDTDKLLQQHADEGQLSKEEQDRQLEEDRREAHRVFEERQKLQQEQNALKRPVGEGEEGVKPTSTSTGLASASGDSKAETATAAPLKLAVTVKKKTTVAAKKKKKAKAKAPAPPVASLVAEYSDSSDE
ncbi:Coiled-coil domain-containing protein 94 [Phytophthora cinnamomi]|uniref:Coiled-coil domain-containing protein 94 n=1 Tax=Phytophthora cinnamomi TaxID=4785 RepID=UPI003559F415|nr:Coiled-coil domain-containing protein 94 [Phytophthora cinnamomi]